MCGSLPKGGGIWKRWVIWSNYSRWKKFPTGNANPQSPIPNPQSPKSQSPENFRPTDLPFLKKYIFSIKFSKTLHFVFDILLDYSKDDVYSVSTRFKTIIYYVITIFEAQKKFSGIISHRISEFDRLWLPIPNPLSPIPNPQSPTLLDRPTIVQLFPSRQKR